MSDASTPMMSQYRRMRAELPPDTILFFRLGDFYEMFFEDAKQAAGILDIALTRRNAVPMCGVPHHSVDLYLAKLIRAGRKVAICEQMEDPALAKGIVRREITRVVTPGTVLEDQVLESRRNNYLAGLVPGSPLGLAFLDLSTGAFWIEESPSEAAAAESLARCVPSECIVPEEQKGQPSVQALLGRNGAMVVTGYEDWTFEFDAAVDLLTRHFKVHSLDGFGCRDCGPGLRAAGAVLHYVSHQLRRQVDHIRQVRVRNPEDFMLLDEATVRNLDLVDPRGGGATAPTLLGALDTTCTAMGGRLLRDWLLRPLTRLPEIEARLDAVGRLASDRRLLHGLREALGAVKDLERLIARLNAGSGNARDVRALGISLGALPGIVELLAAEPAGLTAALRDAIQPLPDTVGLIERALVDEPPASTRDGGMIRAGFHEELDALREAATKGRQWLVEFQAREQERTGIKSLKVRHNKVFGYYIEITKANLAAAPADYQRKQTLVNGERFVTPELKEYENRILGAQERSIELEQELFAEVRQRVVAETGSIQRTADSVAALDVLAALAERALALRYAKPRVTAGDVLRIRDGRHPVVETMPHADRFVPNDTLLDGTSNQVMIITGPNMAGKSTYIRQVALIVVMAQMGSFVPASEAEIGIVDRVFTRVGASDDLARGRSTFMVEMQETANILVNATPRSLIVLDEIGRGTSTFDGISIAWAVAEHLHNHAPVKAKTLFATHYHELTDLSLTLPGVRNYNILVRESGERIAFLRKIAPGAADKSYGIQVARLAGLPAEVIERAREILTNLEEGEFGEGGQPKLAEHRLRRRKADDNQLSLFDPEAPDATT
jgi:DNA mismatch repair protein MutS